MLKGVLTMNVLLIGDSIRMFYEKEVKSILGEKYNVYSTEENCRFSAYVLNNLRFWLSDFPTPDVIHFNCGLWDTAILYKEDGCFTDIDQYLSNMKKILRVLKSTGASIIFATTTPVSDEKQNLAGPMPPAHKNSDIMKFNAAVLEIFNEEDIYINDLFSLMFDEKEKYLSDDMIHPNDDGIKLLGTAVAEAIKKCPVSEKKHFKPTIKKTVLSEKTLQ